MGFSFKHIYSVDKLGESITMGTIVQGLCPQCGYQARVFSGGGLRDCEPETALNAVNGSLKLTAALKNGASFSIERRAAACPNCRELVAAARVIYRQRENNTQNIIAGPCPNCGGKPDWPGSDTDCAPCPRCGSKIPLVPVGHWD